MILRGQLLSRAGLTPHRKLYSVNTTNRSYFQRYVSSNLLYSYPINTLSSLQTNQFTSRQSRCLSRAMVSTISNNDHQTSENNLPCPSMFCEETWKIINTVHDRNNVPEVVKQKIGARLLHKPSHPLSIIKNRIHAYYTSDETAKQFMLFDDLNPLVTTEQNFDSLLTPEDHVSRKPSDTFYVNQKQLLRCHTSAHQTDIMRSGESAFLVAGDVYRRDEIDSSHYPVFHQMEGVRIFSHDEISPSLSREEKENIVVKDLKHHLEGMVKVVFGEVEAMRWVDAYFPFTEPSFELEIFWEGDWIEVLGCGMIAQGVLDNAGKSDHVGWAFGLGLERLAMILFDIPDIRLFWTQDSRFHEQFSEGKITKFQPYSKYPPCHKDVAFWLPQDGFESNDLYEIIRGVAGDLVETVKLIDDFTHPKTGKTSHCYRITYRSMDRSLTNAEVDVLQETIRQKLPKCLNVELR